MLLTIYSTESSPSGISPCLTNYKTLYKGPNKLVGPCPGPAGSWPGTIPGSSRDIADTLVMMLRVQIAASSVLVSFLNIL